MNARLAAPCFLRLSSAARFPYRVGVFGYALGVLILVGRDVVRVIARYQWLKLAP